MPEIVLTTLNARYAHSSLALRYLHANLGPLRERACVREFVIHERPVDVVEALLALEPRIIGIGVYVWNAAVCLQVVRILAQVAPEVTVVVGGPEVSYEVEDQEICRRADYVVTGEGEDAFRTLCEDVLAGRPPLVRVRPGGLPDLQALVSPYALYDDDDIARRVIYVEASRGCPFRCEFCLSSLDQKVRAFPLERFLADMDALWRRGVRQLKFIDRTFNLKIEVSRAILAFFLDRLEPGAFLHFEMIPDRLPAGLREVIARFPPGALQFEVGIQTFDPDTAARISRRQDHAALEDNLRFLRAYTGVHVHADLIAGLPGEDLETFARGFDRLVALAPQEIQLGILKRLRGTPIVRHTEDFGMVYADEPPYEVLRTAHLSFAELQAVKRVARAWDLVVNSGNFRDSAPLLWRAAPSPFRAFWAFTEWLAGQVGPFAGIALGRLTRLVFHYLTEQRGFAAAEVAPLLAGDHVRPGRGLPEFLRPHLAEIPAPQPRPAGIPARQARHLR